MGQCVVLWWEMEGSYPVASGLFSWESRLVLTFSVWVSFGLCVHCLNTLLWGFLVSFSLSLAFNLFPRFSIGVILFSIILLSLCLSLSGRFEASALLNMFFLVDSILASTVLARFLPIMSKEQ